MSVTMQGPLASTPATPDNPVVDAPQTDEAAKPEKKKAEPRDYKVMKSVSGTAEKLKKAIDECVKDGKGEIHITLGKANALQPKLALTKWGQENDLDDEYVLAAERSFTKLTAKSEQVSKRKVRIS